MAKRSAAKRGRPRKKRAAGWSKRAVIRGLEQGKSLREVCRDYVIEGSPTSLVNEVRRWRDNDEEFNAACALLIKPRTPGSGKKSIVETRPDLYGDWKMIYCERVFQTGSRLEAAQDPAVPYDYQTIYKMITPGYNEYQKDFADMVHEVELRFCAEAEGLYIEALRDAKTPRDRAWIARSLLERRDPLRWGKQVEMIHSGSVRHDHQVQDSRAKLLAELVDDQRRYFEKKNISLSLPAGDILEAEVINAEKEQ